MDFIEIRMIGQILWNNIKKHITHLNCKILNTSVLGILVGNLFQHTGTVLNALSLIILTVY